MTHAEGVLIAAKWLVKERCAVVATEVRTWEKEIPDAIGFRFDGACTLVEVKVSLTDFKRDATKRHRQFSDGIGQLRHYLVPKGLIPHDMVPDGYGLIEVSETGKVSRVINPTYLDHDPRREKYALVRIMRGITDPLFMARHNVHIGYLKVPR